MHAERNDAFSTSLAEDPQGSTIEINVLDADAGDLASTEAGGVEDLQHSAVADTLRRAIGSVQKPFDLRLHQESR
jgi:hypothetical protein